MKSQHQVISASMQQGGAGGERDTSQGDNRGGGAAAATELPEQATPQGEELARPATATPNPAGPPALMARAPIGCASGS
jgi:hypothetical protein